MDLLIATTNPHKVREIETVLKPLGIDVTGLDQVEDTIAEPEETGDTFDENARQKAIYYARATGRHCLADDSGLEVDALGGAPGIHSARYAGLEGDREARDVANNAKLLKELEGVADRDRTARFVCAMCLADPEGNIVAETQGSFPGVIAHHPKGSNGFGYDPLLFLPGNGCTSAELTPEEKNRRSHRGEAARKMAQCVREIGFGEEE